MVKSHSSDTKGKLRKLKLSDLLKPTPFYRQNPEGKQCGEELNFIRSPKKSQARIRSRRPVHL